MTEAYVLFFFGGLCTVIGVLGGLIFREITRRIARIEAEISETKTVFIRILTRTRDADDAEQATRRINATTAHKP